MERSFPAFIRRAGDRKMISDSTGSATRQIPTSFRFHNKTTNPSHARANAGNFTAFCRKKETGFSGIRKNSASDSTVNIRKESQSTEDIPPRLNQKKYRR